jgi:hypothetical protein
MMGHIWLIVCGCLSLSPLLVKHLGEISFVFGGHFISRKILIRKEERHYYIYSIRWKGS